MLGGELLCLGSESGHIGCNDAFDDGFGVGGAQVEAELEIDVLCLYHFGVFLVVKVEKIVFGCQFLNLRVN